MRVGVELLAQAYGPWFFLPDRHRNRTDSWGSRRPLVHQWFRSPARRLMVARGSSQHLVDPETSLERVGSACDKFRRIYNRQVEQIYEEGASIRASELELENVDRALEVLRRRVWDSVFLRIGGFLLSLVVPCKS